MRKILPPIVVFLAPHPPAVDFNRKFFVAEFTAAGFEVHYWDVGPLMNFQASFRSSTDNLRYLRISSHTEFIKRARLIGGRSIFVPQITRNFDSYKVHLIVQALRLKTVFFARGYLPHISEARSLLQLLKMNAVRKTFPPVSSARVKNFVYRLLPRMGPYDIVFTAGQLAERIHKKEARKMVPIHHPDLDIMSAKCENSKSRNEIIFLDNYLTNHPDFGLTGAATIGADEYHQSLCDFFGRVEQVFDTEVVIAAHPKADYPDDTFGGRRIVFDGTVDLVRNSRLVLAHFSTAISFAVVYGKPIFLLTSAAIEKTYPSQSQQLQATAALLGSPVYRLDDGAAQSMVEPQVVAEKYQAFHTTFLSDAPEARSSAEIVVEEVLQLLSSTS